MATGKTSRLAKVAIAATIAALTTTAAAAQAPACGNDGGGFEAWKAAFLQQAEADGVGPRALNALAGADYARATIRADRGQKSFKLSLEEFMRKRGAETIVSRGTKLKSRHADMLAGIEAHYGVSPGPLLAIWGMETGFGGFLGEQNILAAVATLAYDCRRSEFFTGHLYAALRLLETGVLSPKAVGAAHGEIGQTQFLPGNALRYGVDGNGDGRVDLIGSQADALASTANFLRAHGWQPGAGYGPGEPNFVAIQGWNAAGVYQQAIAIIAARIDG